MHAEPRELDALDRLGQSIDEARGRIDGGNDVWMVLDGNEPLFACCTFRKVAPVAAAAHGTLTLPPGRPAWRTRSPRRRTGRGIAPGAWTLICDELRADGFTTLVTKIETENAASRRAVEKVGFHEIAVMDHRRLAMHSRTAVRPLSNGLGDDLAERSR